MFVTSRDSVSAGSRPGAMRVFLLLALSTSLLGCVQRRMMIRSNPPGALVYVDDYEIGTTPIATDFTYYGQRKIRLVKDSYETLTVMLSVPPPWYQIPPLDFVSENLVPGEIRDQRSYCYQLAPQVVVPTEQLLSRAEDLRRGVHAVAATAPLMPPADVRINPPAVGPSIAPPSAFPSPTAEELPAPPGIGGQPIYPLSPGVR